MNQEDTLILIYSDPLFKAFVNLLMRNRCFCQCAILSPGVPAGLVLQSLLKRSHAVAWWKNEELPRAPQEMTKAFLVHAVSIYCRCWE